MLNDFQWQCYFNYKTKTQAGNKLMRVHLCEPLFIVKYKVLHNIFSKGEITIM